MEKLSSTSFADLVRTKEIPEIAGQEYLLGLRGLLVIETFLWTFLVVFAPNTVKDAAINVDGPGWQTMFRKTLSVLFWNQTLIYAFFIILSARTLAIPFFKAPSKIVVASAVFRRGIRLAIPTSISLGIITAAFSILGVGYINEFKMLTGNLAIRTPLVLNKVLIYFNSVYQLFWITQNFFTQSGNYAFPSSTLWAVNLVYQQSYTVFIIMIIVPYTRREWRVKMSIPFIITAWWVDSWSWYSISGLLMADMVMNMDFKAKSKRGIPLPFIKAFRLPSWVPAAILMAGGLTMQYLWTAWRPDMLNQEVEAHTGLYYGGELNRDVDTRQPQARDDNYLFVVGFFILLETFESLQNLFHSRFLIYLGRRSLSKSHQPAYLTSPNSDNESFQATS